MEFLNCLFNKTIAPKIWLRAFSMSVSLLVGWSLVNAGLVHADVNNSQAAIGFVILAKGKVSAQSLQGADRNLKRRSKLFNGDKIYTAENSKAQIKFTDGSIIALAHNTELIIEDYQFDSTAKGKEKSFIKLVKGGFRAITGVIGKSNAEDYKVKTNLATIGIRGTHFELVKGESLGVAVWDGGVWVENQAGKMALGKDSNYQFALVSDIGQPPKGLLKPPPGIAGSNQADGKASKKANTSRQKQKAQNDKAEKKQNGNQEKKSANKEQGIATADDAESEADKNAEPGDGEEPGKTKAPVKKVLANNDAAGQAESTQKEKNSSDRDKQSPGEQPNLNGAGKSNQQPKSAATEQSTLLAETQAQDQSSESPAGVTNPANNGDQNSAVNMDSNPAAGGDNGAEMASKSPQLASAPSAAPTDNSRSFANGGSQTMSTPQGQQMALPKLASASSDHFGGNDTNDGIDHFDMAASAKFGLLEPEQVLPPPLPAGCTGDDSGTTCIAEVEQIFDAGEKFNLDVNSQDLEQFGSSQNEEGQQGGGAVNDGNPSDARLTAGEAANLLPFAVLSVAAPSNQQNTLPFVILDEVLVLTGDAENQAFVQMGDTTDGNGNKVPIHVIRNGQSNGEIFSQLDDIPIPNEIFYGLWRGDISPVRVFSDPSSATSFSNLDFPLFWLHAPPTQGSELANLTGIFYYDNVEFFAGAANTGPVQGFHLRMDIDFESLAIVDGEMQIITGPQNRPELFGHWNFDFSGSIDDQFINIDGGILQGAYSPPNQVQSQQAQGQLVGFFSGENGQRILGAFNTWSLEEAGNYSSGVFGVRGVDPLDRLGMVAIVSGKQFGLTADNLNGETYDQAIIGGKASEGEHGSPQLVQRQGSVFDPDFDTSPLVYSVSRGEAPFERLIDELGDDLPGGLAVGRWLGSAETPVLIETADGLVAVDRSVYWLTVQPTPADTMNILEAVGVYYDNVEFYSGQGSAGPITDLQMGFSVDFNNNQINSGFLHIETQGENGFDLWNFSFDGSVNQQVLSFGENFSGYLCDDPLCSNPPVTVDGEVFGVFTGSGANTVVGLFRFWQSDNFDRFVTGGYGVETGFPTLGFDNRIGGDFTAGEQFNLSTTTFHGFSVIGNNTPLGLTSDNGAEEEIVFEGYSIVDQDAGQLNLLQEHRVEPFGVVFRPDDAVLDQNGRDEIIGDRNVYWGRWASNGLIQNDAIDPTNAIKLSDPVFWVAGNPTSYSALPVNEQRSYQTTIMLQGMGYNGAISNGSMSMDISFDAMSEGTLSNGQLSYETGNGASQWNIQFEGSTFGAYVDIEASNAELMEGGITRPLIGDMRGLLVGEAEINQGVIGGFRFEVWGDGSKHSEGVFFVGQ